MKEQIFIDYENEDYEEENNDEIMAEMAKAGTEITNETKTEASDGETKAFILCHICEGYFSTNNSIITLECHLKSKYLNIYKNLGQDETSSSESWTIEVQNEKYKLFINWIITNQQLFTIISLTMDMWTTISSLGILTVTIHFIKDDWQFDHFIIDVFYVSSSHTALIIKDSIIKIISELNITNQLIGITSDNEAKMLAAT
ncbi:zinc finger BED domain-containing protein RICESLEEPER 2-like [Rhizophagus clarus]|uniref:Zinc finger BED domain-containing protein RICESLEEPER 2-like n=1 Tax=Rhizophagus clarus TaxID=94130 RepID=A0A8H3M657_9GLOM|nr:zinc finger BED domain-containing protein RICESLEEPER 2-like [Rhizophagus clarus]